MVKKDRTILTLRWLWLVACQTESEGQTWLAVACYHSLKSESWCEKSLAGLSTAVAVCLRLSWCTVRARVAPGVKAHQPRADLTVVARVLGYGQLIEPQLKTWLHSLDVAVRSVPSPADPTPPDVLRKR